MATLYKAVDPLDDLPVTYVGCYVLRWGKVDELSVGFVPVEIAGLSTEALESGAVARLVELVQALDCSYAIIAPKLFQHDWFRCVVCGNTTTLERSALPHSSKCPVPVALAVLEPDKET